MVFNKKFPSTIFLYLLLPVISKPILQAVFTCIAVQRSVKQDMTAISSDKKECASCSVLASFFLHRRVDKLTTTARARLI